jgi:hypothetical protein
MNTKAIENTLEMLSNSPIDNKEFLALKYGGLKTWKFNDNEEAKKLIDEYNIILNKVGSFKRTERQKQICLELIDIVKADEIYLNFEGEYVTKEQAKNYILTYKEK